MADTIKGIDYALKNNIDTDQMIPADRLTWNPAKPDERLKLGSYAFDGLPDDFKKDHPFITLEERPGIADGTAKARYKVITAGKGFGCGSSREHAANALGAAGVEVVVAKGYARIFFENCVATGELLPATSREDISDKFETGDEVEVDLVNNRVYNLTKKTDYEIEPLGYVKPVVEAGGLFAFARKVGLIGDKPKE